MTITAIDVFSEIDSSGTGPLPAATDYGTRDKVGVGYLPREVFLGRFVLPFAGVSPGVLAGGFLDFFAANLRSFRLSCRLVPSPLAALCSQRRRDRAPHADRVWGVAAVVANAARRAAVPPSLRADYGSPR